MLCSYEYYDVKQSVSIKLTISLIQILVNLTQFLIFHQRVNFKNGSGFTCIRILNCFPLEWVFLITFTCTWKIMLVILKLHLLMQFVISNFSQIPKSLHCEQAMWQLAREFIKYSALALWPRHRRVWPMAQVFVIPFQPHMNTLLSVP